MAKQDKIVILFLCVLLSIFLTGCNVLKGQDSERIPDAPETEISVGLGEEFTLMKGQYAIVRGLDVSLRIEDFIYSPCPEGSQCVWSGLAVVYELNVDGRIYGAQKGNLPSEAPYDVSVEDSDYKTYATFIIDKPETGCIRQSGIPQDECWRGLAIRFDDESYCDSILTQVTKDACYEDLAEKLSSDKFCEKVVSPKQYCQYLKLVAQDEINLCDSIIKFHWRARCFKDISENTGEGISICDKLEPDKAKLCREMISGPDY